jgi:hypothetical protein
MDRFSDLSTLVEDARRDTRSVIEDTGCQLGASLLALALARLGEPAEYVVSHYLRPGETETGSNEHAWVEVEGVLLDPTRDQFGESHLSASYDGRYVPRERTPASAMEEQVYMQLGLQWRVPARQGSIRKLIQRYGMDIEHLEACSATRYTMGIVGRSDTLLGRSEEGGAARP